MATLYFLPTLQAVETNLMSYIIMILGAVVIFGLGLWLRPIFDRWWAAKEQATPNKAEELIELNGPPEPYVKPAVHSESGFAQFERQYRQKLIEQAELIPFWSMVEQEQIFLSRDEFFVAPYFHLIDDEGQPLRLNELLDNFQHLALLGVPGCGKTETIYYLLLTQARQQANDRLGLRDDRVPVLLSATELALALNTLADLPLAAFLQQQFGNAPAGYVQNRLKEGRFLILLDSLNELFISDVEKIVHWLESQIGQHPNNPFIVVGRPALQHIFSQNAALTVVQFAPLSTNSLEEIAKKWQSVIPHTTDTLAKILQDDATYALAQTPFHLVMMLTIANRLSSLPTRRVQLYPVYLSSLLSAENEAASYFAEGESYFVDHEKRALLQTLAFTMHQRHQVYMERDSLGKALRGQTAEGNGELFVEFCLESGLLRQKGDMCRFTQLNLQEFLMAREIVEDNLHNLLVKQTGDLWWEEVINFYAELTDTTPVINRVFTQETKELITAAEDKQAQTLALLDQSMDSVENEVVEEVASPKKRPAKKSSKTSTQEMLAQVTTVSPEPSDGHKPLILVVDDTPQNLKFARFILQRGNYEVAEANTAIEAIEWLKTNRPTLILSDIQMPQMNGYEFCQYLKENEATKDIPFIFVTAFSRASKEIVKGLQMGADDYVPRPFAPEELLARIGANVRVHEAEESARHQAIVLARRNRELALLNKIQQAVTASLNLDEVLDATLQQVQRVVDAEAASLWFIDRENQTLMLSASFNPTITPEDVKRIPLNTRMLLKEGIYSQVVETGESFFSTNIVADTNIQLLIPHSTDLVHSMICVPLRVRERVIGLLQALHRQANQFNQDDFTLLSAVADAVTVAMENAWLFGQLRGFNQQLEQKVKARTRELSTEKEKTDTILTSIADGLLVIDPDKRIIRANPAMDALLGLNVNQMVGVSIDHPNFNTPLWKFIREIQKQSDDTYTAAVDVPSPKNPEKILSFQANAAKMWEQTRKTYLGTVIALRDVTALQEVDRMKANFMTGITHELKTPLAIISLQLGGLLKYYDRLDETKKMDMLHKIERAAELLGRLVDSILELSKLDSGMLQFKFGPVDMVELIRQVVNELQPLANEKSIQLDLTINQEVIIVEADRNQLERVIRNLVENGIKYTPQGRVAVSLSQNGQAKFEVTDTGIGLSDDQIERLFERFYRADNQRNILGTGLGLSIAKEIVKHHKGEIQVRSMLGKGSTFTVVLPLKR